MAGFIGSGDVYVERLIGGVSDGLIHIGNAQKLEVKENSDTKTRTSKQRANYGSALDTVVIKKPADVMMTLDDLNRDNLALLFMGSVSDGAISGASVTDEAHVIGDPGSMVALAAGNVSTVTITGMVLGTDFEVADADAGFIRFIEGGNAAKGATALISYVGGGTSGTLITGGVDANVTMKIIMLGKNLVDDSAVRLTVFKAIVTPQSGVDFLSEDFTELELTGVANVPSGQVAAYTLELNRANV